MEARKSHAAANSSSEEEDDALENEAEQTTSQSPVRSAPFKTTAARKTASQPAKHSQGAVTVRAARKTTSSADGVTSGPVNPTHTSTGLSSSDITNQSTAKPIQSDQERDLTAETGGKTDRGSESEIDELQQELELELDSESEVSPPESKEEMVEDDDVHPPLGQGSHATTDWPEQIDSSAQVTHVSGTQYADDAEPAESQ